MPPEGWSSAGHVCRFCLDAVVQRGGDYLCQGCNREAVGAPTAVCGCGLASNSPRTIGTFRCGPNPNRSKASPDAYAILFGGFPTTDQQERA